MSAPSLKCQIKGRKIDFFFGPLQRDDDFSAVGRFPLIQNHRTPVSDGLLCVQRFFEVGEDRKAASSESKGVTASGFPGGRALIRRVDTFYVFTSRPQSGNKSKWSSRDRTISELSRTAVLICSILHYL